MGILGWTAVGVVAFNVLLVLALWRLSILRDREKLHCCIDLDRHNRSPRHLPSLTGLSDNEKVFAIADWMLGLERPAYVAGWPERHRMFLTESAYEAFEAQKIPSWDRYQFITVVKTAANAVIHELACEEIFG